MHVNIFLIFPRGMERCTIYDFTLCERAVQEKWNMSDVPVIGPSTALWIAPVVYWTLSDKHTYSLVKNIAIKATVLTVNELLNTLTMCSPLRLLTHTLVFLFFDFDFCVMISVCCRTCRPCGEFQRQRSAVVTARSLRFSCDSSQNPSHILCGCLWQNTITSFYFISK